MQTEERAESKRKGENKIRYTQVASEARVIPVEESLKLATPAWPLQNTVAVNPFWFLRNRSFDSVVRELTPVIHASLFMPIEYYIGRLQEGQIDEKSLQEAITAANQQGHGFPKEVQAFKKMAESLSVAPQTHRTFAEIPCGNVDWHIFIKEEVGKFAAGYFDESQAIAPFPWRSENFWSAWLHAVQFDRSMEIMGGLNFRENLADLEGCTSVEAIDHMCLRMGLISHSSQLVYMQRLVATVMGWMSRFKYSEWQNSLGYTKEIKTSGVDLLAVRMAYDYGIYISSEMASPMRVEEWRAQYRDYDQSTDQRQSSVQYVFQLATELSYQRRLAGQISLARTELKVVPKTQMAFCIDVRSEMIRRHIERADKHIQTIGFAGFFGVPFDYKRLGEKAASHRLPVLLKPDFVVKERPHREVNDRLVDSVMANSYFRNLRKNAFSSFLYVELFGLKYVSKMVYRTWEAIADHLRREQLPERFNNSDLGPSQHDVVSVDGSTYDYAKKVERATVVLKHMGLTDQFAELVIIVGHGSQTTNNAFGSALDCGACGGHAGDINARFLADLLNDRKVRKGLEENGIVVPASTVFVAAVHETVTDEIHILDQNKLPLGKRMLLQEIDESLMEASENTRRERNQYLSPVLDPRSGVRSRNWSEVRPEWGLAGNACFIVAPRKRTQGLDLASRSFLHDYDWKKDQLNGFKTLELIMTAPMVVTNWINMQYYTSTVAPQLYGSGNKILHNVTNEFGVVEGNGGDLRVGLPIQSVHDGKGIVHEPLRLSVFIEAPVEEIERVISKHQVVRELVENEWLHLLHIDTKDSRVSKRQRDGGYSPI